VMAFSVSQRTQEIAIRVTLGAHRAGIAKLVLVSGVRLTLLGSGLGVLGSLALSRLVSSFLFGVSATDPLIYILCVLIMMIMALLASDSSRIPRRFAIHGRSTLELGTHLRLGNNRQLSISFGISATPLDNQ